MNIKPIFINIVVMRIAFIVAEFPIISETFILNQITGLIERGHSVDIYALDKGSADNTYKVHPDVEKYHLLDCTYYAPKIPGNQLLRVLQAPRLLFANWHKDPLVLLRSLNFFKYGKQAASWRLVYTAIPFLGKEPYDIIHCQFGMYGLKGMWLRHIGAFDGKLITSFRGFDISWYIQKYGERVYNELFDKGDFFLPNCEYFKRLLLEFGCDEKKIVVHRSGIDCSRFVFTPRRLHSDDRVRIATTGRLIEKKGIEYSIRAIALIANLNPNIEYNIIGDGPLRENLQQLINSLNVSNIVKLLGWKKQQEVIEILNNSHIFIAPSVTGNDGDQEGIPNVLKEAMAMGLPVIGTIHGGIPELIEDGISGFLVPERDADAISQKLSYLIENSQVWPEMGRAGRTYVEEHYDINKLNDELVQIYQQLLN